MTAPQPRALDHEATVATCTFVFGNAAVAQPVQAFARYVATGADLLVQPVDMNPVTSARCDCTYEIAIDLTLPQGNTVSVYRRADHHAGGDGTPILIGTASAGAL